jgi:hypothetical protein
MQRRVKYYISAALHDEPAEGEESTLESSLRNRIQFKLFVSVFFTMQIIEAYKFHDAS